jgi:outer membrane protein TolC
VLGAFEQVADTLRALDHDAAALQAEMVALTTAEQALHLVQVKYEAGLITYLDVLNADTQYHQAKIAELQAIAVRYQDTVALFAAIGGGWWSRADARATVEALHGLVPNASKDYSATQDSVGTGTATESRHE